MRLRSAPPKGTSVSIFRAVVTVIVTSTMIVFALAEAAGAVLTVAIMAGYAHGFLDDGERLFIFVSVLVIEFTFVALIGFLLEKWTFGPLKLRSPAQRYRPWHSRLLTLMLSAVVVLGGPPVARELRIRSALRRAETGSGSARHGAVNRLGRSRDPRALDVLERIANEENASAEQRAAVRALALVPGGHEVLLKLGEHPEPGRRALAGESLIRFAKDEDAWARIITLARDDPDATVREAMIEALATNRYGVPDDKLDALFREQSSDPSPNVRLRVAFRVSEEAGVDAALSLARDPTLPIDTRLQAISTLRGKQSEQAAAFLFDLVEGTYEPGLVPEGEEERFRDIAGEAFRFVYGERFSDYPNNYAHELRILIQIAEVLRAQFAYKHRTEHFDGRLGCVAEPWECVPGYPRYDRSFLGLVLASGRPKDRYERRFYPGPRVLPEELDASVQSPSSVVDFAYVAYPLESGRYGTRAFCGDSTGRICFTRDGRRPEVRHGRCPDSNREPWSKPLSHAYNRGRVLPCLDWKEP